MTTEPVSKNERAREIMGMRPTGYQPIDFPAELGYRCPVCKETPFKNDQFDLRLEWSEYNGFLYCSVCNRDYPSALCMPDIDRATGIYLDTVKDAVEKTHKGQYLPTPDEWLMAQVKITSLETELAKLTDENRWRPAIDPPEQNVVEWSDYVLLAYKIRGGRYRGAKIVSRYHHSYATGKMEWEYGTSKLLSDYDYEPVAWRPLPEGPNINENSQDNRS